MIVNAIHCLECNNIIFSRYRHDMRWCGCGNNAIDGGRDYLRGTTSTDKSIPIKLETGVEQVVLYKDFNLNDDKYGRHHIDNLLPGMEVVEPAHYIKQPFNYEGKFIHHKPEQLEQPDYDTYYI